MTKNIQLQDLLFKMLGKLYYSYMTEPGAIGDRVMTFDETSKKLMKQIKDLKDEMYKMPQGT
jgi:hypothetical protein